ncbi:hypothetical protein BDN67DRAFT_1043586 [Paxillus ammoniavirescens]|nr:hypothetical protein BDN67DRAFT_1043586 [Paxillus ammoniavirescens]
MPIILMVNHLPGFNAATVSTAMAAQLKFWIDKVNVAAGRKVLMKVGRVDDLRHKLTAHYGLDLSTPVISNIPTAISPASTLDIQNHQWDYLRDLATSGRSVPPQASPSCSASHPQNDSLHLLSEVITSLDVAPSSFLTPLAFTPTTLTPIPTNDTIQALRVAAHAGDCDACALLRHLYRMLVPEGLLSDSTAAAATTSWSPSACTITTSDPGTMTPPTVPTTLLLVTTPAQPALLCEVIEQVEEGHVQQIRDKYGPCKGRRPHPLWENVKVTVNWQEQLIITSINAACPTRLSLRSQSHAFVGSQHAQLMNEFVGDKVHLFDFFTRQPQDESGSSKGKHKASSESLYALHKVVKAIPRQDKDLRGERLRGVYRGDEGDFSEANHWGSMNSWEVWRAMDMERID